MSLLFIKEEELPRVDAVVLTHPDDNASCNTITVDELEIGLDFPSTVREVTAFFTRALTEAEIRKFESVAMYFPSVFSRRGITWLLRVNMMRIVSRFDIDVYIIVSDRQREMMRRAINIDDFLYPKMLSRRISASESSVREVASKKLSLRTRYEAPEEDVDACYSVEEACFFETRKPSLAKFIRDMDDTFAVRLLKLIDRREMTEVECYKAANVSRQTWYKIMNDGDYRPSKTTVISFAIALKLDYEETQALLATAGYTLSHSILFDKIIAYCIDNEIYDVFEINAMLYSYDQECLGA